MPFPAVPHFPPPTTTDSTGKERPRTSRTINSRKSYVNEEKESSRKVFLDVKNVIFTRTKMSGLWIPALKETTTATGAPPDEYERPDDLKEISINRIEARNIKNGDEGNEDYNNNSNNSDNSNSGGNGSGSSTSNTTSTSKPHDTTTSTTTSFDARLKMSVFGQLVEGIKNWDERPLRRSFVHMQDAGQARAFFVKFTGKIF